ncbi:MAG: hypothetical protein ACK4TG_04470, partial [Thermaurantiacus sp.]
VARDMVANDPNDRGGLQMVAVAGEIASQLAADAGDARTSAVVAEEVLSVHDQLVALAGDAPGARRTRASAMRTIAGNRDRLGDRPGACAMWKRTLAEYDSLGRRDQLTDYDRNNGLPEGRAYLAANC